MASMALRAGPSCKPRTCCSMASSTLVRSAIGSDRSSPTRCSMKPVSNARRSRDRTRRVARASTAEPTARGLSPAARRAVELLASALRGPVDVLAYDVACQAGEAFERQHRFVARHDDRVGAVGDDPCLFGQVAETVDAARADRIRRFEQVL